MGSFAFSQEVDDKQLRKFGLIISAAALLFTFSSAKLRPHAFWSVSLAMIVLLSAALLPRILKPFYRMWMSVGLVLGAINQRILLMLIFFALIVPIGFIMRMLKTARMPLNFDPRAKTYRTICKPKSSQRMEAPYL